MHHYAYLIHTPAIHFFKPLHITIHRWSQVFHKPWPTTKKNVLLSTSCQSYSLLMNVNRFSNSVCPMQMEVLDHLVPYHPSKEFWNYSRINRQVPWAQLFGGRLTLNPGLDSTWVSFSFGPKHFLGQFSLLFLRASNYQLVDKKN